MKINWGQGIFIAIIICVSAIIFLVILSSREKIDLVTDEYYPKGLVYEEQIVKLKNTQKLTERIKLEQSQTELNICFPKNLGSFETIEGDIWLYFPADKNKDFKDKISLDSNFCHSISLENRQAGKYKLVLDWSGKTNQYYQETILFIDN